MSFVQVMDAEIAALEAKLTAVRAARAAYIGAEAEIAVPADPAPPAPPPPASPPPSTAKAAAPVASAPVASAPVERPKPPRTAKATEARRNPQKAKLLNAARLYIEQHGGPVTTVDMLKHLQEKGFKIGGAKPRNNLASTFSSSDLFQTNGRLGWTLKAAGPPAG